MWIKMKFADTDGIFEILIYFAAAAALNCRTAWLTSNSLKTVRKAGYHPGRPGFGQGKKGLLPSLTVTIFSSVLHSRND